MFFSFRKLLLVGAAVALTTPAAFAFEDTKVMPKKIRRLSLRVVNTSIAEKTDGGGTAQALARPLKKDLTFRDILNGEKDPITNSKLAGYLKTNGFAESDAVGRFDADLQARITVFAPIATYGLTDNITVAVAAPIYNAATSVGMAFNKNATADRFSLSFANPETNNIPKGQEVAARLDSAVERVNQKLEKNGRKPLSNWHQVAMGDTTLLAKYRLHDGNVLKFASTNGVVAPTGRIDDPRIMTDLPFGDGQWDIFTTAALDQRVLEADVGITINEYARYTWQLPSRKMVSLNTDVETIEVPIERIRYKLGDKVEAGTSIQLDSQIGVAAGVGYNYFRKFSDIYRAGTSSSVLERDTDTQYHQAELEFGYSTVPAFRRKEFPVPMETKVNYKHLLKSRNQPVTQFVQVETGLFF